MPFLHALSYVGLRTVVSNNFMIGSVLICRLFRQLVHRIVLLLLAQDLLFLDRLLALLLLCLFFDVVFTYFLISDEPFFLCLYAIDESSFVPADSASSKKTR